MPSLARSNRWAFRVTGAHDYLKERLKVVIGWIDYESHAVGFHVGEKTNKPHAHVVIKLKSDLQKQSFDVRVKNVFGLTGGNKDYSSKPWDGSLKAISYLYHDKKGEVDVSKMNLTEAELKEVNDMDVLYTEIVEDGKKRASGRCVDRILEEIKNSGKTMIVSQIARRILLGVRRQEWHPPGFQFENYVQEILLRQGSDDDAEAQINECVNGFMDRWNKRWGN